MATTISFAVYDENGAPLTGLVPGFSTYQNAAGVEQIQPAITELGGGLYAFEPSTDDEDEGRGFILATGGSPAMLSGQVGEVDQFFALFDLTGAPYAGAAPTIATYKDALGADVLPVPTVTDIGAGLYVFTPNVGDRAAHVNFEIDTNAASVPTRLAGQLADPTVPAGGGADQTPPVVDGFDPPAGDVLGPTGHIQFDVTVATGVPLRSLQVIAEFPIYKIKEIVYDDEAGFAPLYQNGNESIAVIANGRRLRFSRVGGWPTAPVLSVRAVTINGAENA